MVKLPFRCHCGMEWKPSLPHHDLPANYLFSARVAGSDVLACMDLVCSFHPDFYVDEGEIFCFYGGDKFLRKMAIFVCLACGRVERPRRDDWLFLGASMYRWSFSFYDSFVCFFFFLLLRVIEGNLLLLLFVVNLNTENDRILKSYMSLKLSHVQQT